MRVGMLRFPEKPTFLARSIAYVCGHYGIDFFYFTPEDVDLSRQKINGQFLIKGKWIRKETSYPDVIDNEPMRERHRHIYESLEEQGFLTTKRLGSKKKVFRMMEKSGNFNDVLIPYKSIETDNDVKSAVELYGKVLLKPSVSNQGRNVYSVEKINENYQITTDSNEIIYNELEFSLEFNKLITDRSYICQPYIDSTTREGHPFDVRIHTRKNAEGKWSTVCIYPKIGIGNAITSNINQGGGVSEVNAFLKAQFDDKWESVKRELNRLSKSLPTRFQSLYNRSIDALAFDLGIDKIGKVWLFEVNTYPGAKYFFAEDAEARVNYYRYVYSQSVKMNVQYSR
ncbi:YheC/YheD family protein [Gracilibacillus alcaliphilus]|uniref:YheC/YheD family protein n=1 Tax=Gracilibacillus alcaliphilus TaxID=1401441 RepID=UPI00195BF636|nr:YheC/YheD family protein [Gracilibacillus alcaliphilus]MBM7678366.1 hypothetical protein [Gracilibacillus alcaliphilus]